MTYMPDRSTPHNSVEAAARTPEPSHETRRELEAVLEELGKPVECNTASADVDWQAAWEAAVKVVVAAGRFVDAEKDGNADLIEDAHYDLLRALADYRAGAK